MDMIISGRGVYKLSNEALSDYPQIEKIQSKGHKRDIGSSVFDILEDIIFFENKPQEAQEEYVKILGLKNRKRTFYWMNRKYLDAPDSFEEYKVIMPQASGNGSFGEIISSPIVLETFVGATETFLTIGGFKEKAEAESALKYVKTKFARALLSILKITQANTRDKWSKVPKQEFNNSSDIEWDGSVSDIDCQLYKNRA